MKTLTDIQLLGVVRSFAAGIASDPNDIDCFMMRTGEWVNDTRMTSLIDAIHDNIQTPSRSAFIQIAELWQTSKKLELHMFATEILRFLRT